MQIRSTSARRWLEPFPCRIEWAPCPALKDFEPGDAIGWQGPGFVGLALGADPPADPNAVFDMALGWLGAPGSGGVSCHGDEGLVPAFFFSVPCPAWQAL